MIHARVWVRCLYMCECVSVWVRVHVCMRTCVSVWVCVCVRRPTNVYVYVCENTGVMQTTQASAGATWPRTRPQHERPGDMVYQLLALFLSPIKSKK